MKRIIKISVLLLLVVLLTTGCGIKKSISWCRNKSINKAKDYLKSTYNIDVNIESTEVERINSVIFSSTEFGGEPTGKVTVSANYNGKIIELETNCYEDTEITDDVYATKSINEYSHCTSYDEIYFCNEKENLEIIVNNHGEGDLHRGDFGYDDDTKGKSQLLSSYSMVHAYDNIDQYIVIFIPANRLNTTYLEDNKVIVNYRFTSGNRSNEFFDMHLTKDGNYYQAGFRFYPGADEVVFTVIK